MNNTDDHDLLQPVVKLRDLEPMSIEELQDYIVTLEKEIVRSLDTIEKKQIHKRGIESLFGKKE